MVRTKTSLPTWSAPNQKLLLGPFGSPWLVTMLSKVWFGVCPTSAATAGARTASTAMMTTSTSPVMANLSWRDRCHVSRQVPRCGATSPTASGPRPAAPGCW